MEDDGVLRRGARQEFFRDAEAASHAAVVKEFTNVRVRWLGHQLHAEINLAVSDDLHVEAGHEIAKEVTTPAYASSELPFQSHHPRRSIESFGRGESPDRRAPQWRPDTSHASLKPYRRDFVEIKSK